MNMNGGAGSVEARRAVKYGRHLAEECLIAAYSNANEIILIQLKYREKRA